LLLLLLQMSVIAGFADEYKDPATNVIYTYEPGKNTASVKAGYDEVIGGGYGYESEVITHPGSPDAAGDVVILDKFTIGTNDYVVTSIGEFAFWANNNIKSVIIPESVTGIGAAAFEYCDSLSAVQLPEGLTRIPDMLFYDCCSLVSLTLPSGLSYIGRHAFQNTPWYSMQYNEASDGLFYIGPLLVGYKGDAPTGDLVIKGGTTCIGTEALRNCYGLTSVTIPESVAYIDYESFYNCKGLTAVHITNMAAWCNIEFQEEYRGSSNPLFYAHHLYLNGEEVTDLVIPDGVTSIGRYAFDNCMGLTSVTIPEGVTRIGSNAFRSCGTLTSVTIPPSIAIIESNAFLWCRNLNAVHISDIAAWCGISFNYSSNPLCYGAHFYLNGEEVKDLVIPEGVVGIANSAFMNCSSLNSITIPNSMTNIDNHAFSGCNSLTDVYCYATEPPSVQTRFEDEVWDGYPFDQYFIKEHTTLHVPTASVEKYKTALRWSDFGNIVEMETSKGIMPFVQDGKVWTYKASNFIYDWEETYSLEGDTVISSRKCQKLYYTCQFYQQEHLYKGAMFEEEGKVYFIASDSTTPVLMYDFSYEPGTIIKVGEFELRIKETRLVKYRGEYLKVIDYCILGDEEYPFEGIEGLGFIGGGVTCFIDGYTPVNTGGERHLKTCSINGEVVFDLQDFYTSAQVVTKDEVTFTQDQMATIILPSAPDASKGKYYRLDRVEDGQIIFEQELQPRARVPYIIVPDEDFCIDPSSLDLEGLTKDSVSIEGVSFIGSYVRKALPQRGSGEGADSFYIDIIDTTPDCTPLPGEGQGERLFIGALRAYLLVNWSDPYNPGGTRGPNDKLGIVLKDDPNGMIEIENSKFNNQSEGEVVNGQMVNVMT